MPLDSPAEQFEVFDDAGMCTGLVARARVHHQGLWHRSVNVLVIRTDLMLLLQQRAMHKDVCPSRWDLSCGEHLIPKESYVQAAVRGLQEELGISIDNAALSALGQPVRYTYRDEIKDIHDREIQQSFYVQWNGAVAIDRSEVAQTRWVTWSDLTESVRAEPDSYTPWLVSLVTRLPDINEWHNG